MAESPWQLYIKTKTKEKFDQLSLEQQDGIICWALQKNDKEYIKRFYHTSHFVKYQGPIHPIKYYEEDSKNEAVKVCRHYCEKLKEVKHCIDNIQNVCKSTRRKNDYSKVQASSSRRGRESSAQAAAEE